MLIPVGVPESGRRFEVDERDMSRERRFYSLQAGRI